MNALRLLVIVAAVASICSTAGAQAFTEDFESYAAGSALHGVEGWKGWDNTPGAGAPVSDAFAYSGANSVEIVPAADLVHEFDVAGGKWVFSTMMYVPSGSSGETFFIMLNSYDDGANQDWSVQLKFNMNADVINSEYDGAVATSIVYDAWVELKMVIDLDENTVDEYYNGELISTHQWDDNDHGTIGAVDLFGNSASSVYYDDIMLESVYAWPYDPSPADGDADGPRQPVLTWTPGIYAETHDVYFGTSADDVAAATRANPLDLLLSQGQTAATFAPDGLLEFGQTYYWRVDDISADGKTYDGNVWSFKAEPFVYPVENISVTSNTTPEGTAIPENTLNGSGLNENDEHSRNDDTMWLGTSGDEPAYIQYEFDRVYKLYEMLVWNYNGEFELFLAFGIKDVTVEYSEDGEAWTVLDDVTLAQGTSTSDYVANTTIDFAGVGVKFVRLTINSGYGTTGKYGLSEVRFLYTPVHAREPQPADEATDVDINTTLTWRPGREAASHELYFGTDAEALALVETLATASYTPDALDLATTYYWKVDEVNEAEAISTWQGGLWSFATQPLIVVEDFESYDDDANRIYDTWLDGWVNDTGSTVGYGEAPFAEQTIVKSGSQSMPLFYDNAEAATSEAEFELAQNWTTNGIQSLSLYFYGDPDNTGQLYVKINNTKVAYDGDAADITKAIWQPWNIDLSTTGASLSSVSKLTIGIEGANAAGVLYIDDIRLYPLTPEYIVPTEPDVTGLVARYNFDGDATDSSGNGFNGTVNGSPTYVTGADGQAINFNGTTDYVVVGSVGISGADSRTISGWVKPDTLTITDWCNIFGFTSTVATGNRSFDINKRGAQNQYCIHVYGWEQNIMEIDLEWHHLAATYDGTTIAWYGDGQFVGSAAKDDLDTEDIMHMGKRAHSDPMWPGSVDDVRIYNQALSAAEVAGLAGLTEPMHKPF